MAALHLLGTGSAVCDAHRTTTMLALESDGRSLLVDCGGDLHQRALMAGLDPDGIEGLIITHEHPDHVAGFALFVVRLWLGGRTRPIAIYGIEPALAQARRVLDAYATDDWGIPTIEWNTVGSGEHAPVLENRDWQVTASPGVHGSTQVSGYRFVHVPSGYTVAYSADTEPCDTIERLASGCDLLVHEATGASRGHSSIAQAVQTCQRAGCPRLVLVHLSRGTKPEALHPHRDSGIEVFLGEELDCFTF